jgi:hypothetical protein
VAEVGEVGALLLAQAEVFEQSMSAVVSPPSASDSRMTRRKLGWERSASNRRMPSWSVTSRQRRASSAFSAVRGLFVPPWRASTWRARAPSEISETPRISFRGQPRSIRAAPPPGARLYMKLTRGFR